jgi:hypothetical protein
MVTGMELSEFTNIKALEMLINDSKYMRFIQF